MTFARGVHCKHYTSRPEATHVTVARLEFNFSRKPDYQLTPWCVSIGLYPASIIACSLQAATGIRHLLLGAGRQDDEAVPNSISACIDQLQLALAMCH